MMDQFLITTSVEYQDTTCTACAPIPQTRYHLVFPDQHSEKLTRLSVQEFIERIAKSAYHIPVSEEDTLDGVIIYFDTPSGRISLTNDYGWLTLQKGDLTIETQDTPRTLDEILEQVTHIFKELFQQTLLFEIKRDQV